MAPPNVTTNLSVSRPTAEKRSRGEQKSARVAKQPSLPYTSESDQDSGVDEEGLENLVRALGEDGLDEFGLAQLRMLAGSPVEEEESDEEDDDDADPTTQSEDEEQAGEEEADEEIALDDEDVDSVDEDAIPRRKIQVDNEVRPTQLPCLLARLKIS